MHKSWEWSLKMLRDKYVIFHFRGRMWYIHIINGFCRVGCVCFEDSLNDCSSKNSSKPIFFGTQNEIFMLILSKWQCKVAHISSSRKDRKNENKQTL